MIETQNLTVDYGNENGIFDIHLQIDEGQVYALLGRSGCGKTTLLSALAGLLSYDNGVIDIKNKLGEVAKVGLVQQKDALFPWLTVLDNVMLGQKGNKKSKEEEAKKLLVELEIGAYWQSYPSQLSGGQRQRVSIGRTLMSNPEVLLMDEPTTALDAFSKEALQNLLLQLHRKNRCTTLFVTHSIEEALFLADYILIMDKGRIVSTYENPLEHSLALRDDPAFYQNVNALRALLKRGGLSE